MGLIRSFVVVGTRFTTRRAMLVPLQGRHYGALEAIAFSCVFGFNCMGKH